MSVAGRQRLPRSPALLQSSLPQNHKRYIKSAEAIVATHSKKITHQNQMKIKNCVPVYIPTSIHNLGSF